MSDSSSAADLQWTVDLAQRAGELLLEYYRRDVLSSNLKADYSLVTEADLAADVLIAEALAAAYSEDAILSEEDNTRYDVEVPHVWIIDPLDGTTNFSKGLQYWGVSIARVSAGVPSLGVMYFPVLGEMYAARRGGGATLNGRPTFVEPPAQDGRWGMMACCSRTLRFHHVNLPVKMRVFGCATYSLASVARGAASVAMETRPKIWDLAAGVLIVEEAGGVVAGIGDARPFPLQTGLAYVEHSFPLIAAASPEVAERAAEGVQPR